MEAWLCRPLAAAVGNEARVDKSGCFAKLPESGLAERAYLRRRSDDGAGEDIELALYPADTLTQARKFYARPGLSEALQGVREKGWTVAPNFHFGFGALGVCWTTTTRDVDEYVELWRTRIGAEHALREAEWDNYWAGLEYERIATAEDRQKFDTYISTGGRMRASPRPGLGLTRRWPLAAAQQLDAQGRLAPQIRAAIDDALAAFDEPPLASASGGSRPIGPPS